MSQVARKKAPARKYAKKNSSMVNAKNYRAIPRRPRAAPMYKSVPGQVVTGSGKYGLRNAGQDIGRGVGHVLERIFGSGDYAIQANSIMGGVYNPPELHNRSDRTVCLRHREYICDINASTAFTLQSFPINPGMTATFPWLSQVAEAFEEYRFTGIVFEFKTLSADYTTASSAALGYIIMSTQYNVLNPPFTDKITMENYEFSNSAKPSETFLHPVECKRSLNPVSELFVRTGNVTSGDLRLYDHGNFQIATGGNTGSGVLGELWCTFEVELYKPKLVTVVGSQYRTDHYISLPGNINNAAPIGIPILQANSSLGTTITNSNRTVNFPSSVANGNFLVVYTVFGTSTALSGPAFTYVNCTYRNVWLNDTAAQTWNTGSTSDKYIFAQVIDITAPNASFTIGAAGTLPSSPTGMDLWITQIDGDVNT